MARSNDVIRLPFSDRAQGEHGGAPHDALPRQGDLRQRDVPPRQAQQGQLHPAGDEGDEGAAERGHHPRVQGEQKVGSPIIE